MIKKLYSIFFTLLATSHVFCAERIYITKVIHENHIGYTKYRNNWTIIKCADQYRCSNLHNNDTFYMYKNNSGSTHLDAQKFYELEYEFNNLTYELTSPTLTQITRTNTN